MAGRKSPQLAIIDLYTAGKSSIIQADAVKPRTGRRLRIHLFDGQSATRGTAFYAIPPTPERNNAVKRPILILLMLALLASVSFAQPIVIPTLPPDGTYVLTVTGGAVTGFEKANVLRIGPAPTPVDPDDPVDPVPNAKMKAIIDAAQSAVADPQQATTAANLSAVMSLIATQIDARALTNYQAISASVDWLWDQVTKGRESAWRPTKTVIGNHLAAMAQEGASPEEYSGYFAEAANALSGIQYGDAVDESMQIDIAMLMKLFEFFIKFILPLIIR